MTNGPITVFLADDHAMVREGLASLVAGDPSVRVVGQCGDGLKVVRLVRQLKPQVVVLDITMPGFNGLDLCREIKRKAPGVAVLILSMHDDLQLVARAMENGASGYLVKEAAAGQFHEALRTVGRGEVYLAPSIPRSVLSRVRGAKEPYECLTTRERQVLQLIAEGKTSREVADHLGVSIKTIETHRLHLMAKLNIHDQTSLVKFAIRKGIVGLQ